VDKKIWSIIIVVTAFLALGSGLIAGLHLDKINDLVAVDETEVQGKWVKNPVAFVFVKNLTDGKQLYALVHTWGVKIAIKNVTVEIGLWKNQTLVDSYVSELEITMHSKDVIYIEIENPDYLTVKAEAYGWYYEET